MAHRSRAQSPEGDVDRNGRARQGQVVPASERNAALKRAPDGAQEPPAEYPCKVRDHRRSGCRGGKTGGSIPHHRPRSSAVGSWEASTVLESRIGAMNLVGRRCRAALTSGLSGSSALPGTGGGPWGASRACSSRLGTMDPGTPQKKGRPSGLPFVRMCSGLLVRFGRFFGPGGADWFFGLPGFGLLGGFGFGPLRAAAAFLGDAAGTTAFGAGFAAFGRRPALRAWAAGSGSRHAP